MECSGVALPAKMGLEETEGLLGWQVIELALAVLVVKKGGVEEEVMVIGTVEVVSRQVSRARLEEMLVRAKAVVSLEERKGAVVQPQVAMLRVKLVGFVQAMRVVEKGGLEEGNRMLV